MATKKKTSKKKKSNAGRPNTYNPKYHLPWISGLARRGLSMEEIAHEVGVTRQTLYNWMKKNPELFDILNESRSYADTMVENSLYKRAMGGVYTDKRKIGTPDSNGRMTGSKVEITEREIPPDVTACIFWLKNRQPELWRDKREYVPQVDDTQEEDELSKSLRELAEEM